jgi:hypothetical protein
VANTNEIADVLAEARVVRQTVLRPEPAEDSPASHDLSTTPTASVAAVRRLITCADLWTLIAADQLFGVSLLVRNGETVFSLFPLLRSIVEHGASVAWVLDDGADARTRTARASLAALRSQEELAKAASRMGGKGSETHQDAKARLKQLRADVEAEFGSLDLSPLQIANETLASPTDLVERFGHRWGEAREWVGVYDYFCGTANHPSLNAVEYFDRTNPSAGAQIPPDLLNRLLRAALVPHLKALEYLCAYMGWSTEPVDAYIDQINAALGTVLQSPAAEPP